MPLTAIACAPSASGAGTVNGEEHGCAAPPSTSQAKATGRFAVNSIVGMRMRPIAAGALVIAIAGGRATLSTAP